VPDQLVHALQAALALLLSGDWLALMHLFRPDDFAT
jgi:uncharacterized membrane protein YccF (DUF307 family)